MLKIVYIHITLISLLAVKKAKGYEVKYSTSKKFKKGATVTKKIKRCKFAITKIRKNKKYYVKARAFDENLEEYEIEGEGLLARAICHELDHLDGHMYVEKVEGEIHDVQYADPEDEEDWEEIDEEA